MKKTFIPIFLLLLAQVSFAQRVVPELWGHRVHDEAEVLSQGFEDGLETQLKQYEDSTGNQIAVLIIKTLEGDEVRSYSLRVAEAWGLGDKEKDNGVLLLIVINDSKVDIEVGSGLEGVLTDALCNQIIRNEIAPAFRQTNYEGGVDAAVQAIIAGIGNEYTLDGVQHGAEEIGITERIIVGVLIFGILGVFTLSGVFQKGCASWFLYFFLIPFYAIFPHIVIGMTAGLTITAIYIILYPIMKIIIPRTNWGKKIMKDFANTVASGGGGSGGWSSRSSWGGGGWSSGGGGGFSGGGGSFGGGGSSGSW